ncbi:MAG: HEAT repeat domain-containing protein [Bryobacterales bacterium]
MGRHLGDQETRAALVRAMTEDQNPGVRIKALEALAPHAKDKDVRAALVHTVRNDTTPGLRVMAIDLLTSEPDRDIAGVLQELVASEPNNYVKMRCQRALVDLERIGRRLLMRVVSMPTLRFQMKTLALLLGAALSLSAQTFGPIAKDGRFWVQQETGEMAPGSRLRVSVIGAVTVEGRAEPHFEYRVTRRVKADSEAEAKAIFERAHLAAVRRGPTATLTLEEPNCGRCAFAAELEVGVPQTLQEAIVGTRGGEVHIHNVAGRVIADSAGGAMEIGGVGGAVRATTAGGPISLGTIGGEVLCETAGGTISVDDARSNATLTSSGGSIRAGSIGGFLRAETAGGDVTAARVNGRVTAGTSGGSILIGQAGGPVNAESAGGSIEVAFAPKGVRVETAGGRIRLNDVAGQVYAANASGDIQAVFLDGAPLADSLLETNLGTIVVYLPANARLAVEATVDFAKGMNRIETDFPGIQIVQGEDGPGLSALHASGSLNGGGPVLRIRNTSGRIQIRKRQ